MDTPCYGLFYHFFDNGQLGDFVPQAGTHQETIGKVDSRRLVQIGGSAEQAYYFLPAAVGYIDGRGIFIASCVIQLYFPFDIMNQFEDCIMDSYFFTFSLYFRV